MSSWGGVLEISHLKEASMQEKGMSGDQHRSGSLHDMDLHRLKIDGWIDRHWSLTTKLWELNPGATVNFCARLKRKRKTSNHARNPGGFITTPCYWDTAWRHDASFCCRQRKSNIKSCSTEVSSNGFLRTSSYFHFLGFSVHMITHTSMT